MEKGLIKTWLLNKKPGVYSIVVQSYYDRLSEYRTAKFIEWLALELDIPIDVINIASLSSALRRYRKKKGTSPTRSKREGVNGGNFDTDVPDKISFQ